MADLPSQLREPIPLRRRGEPQAAFEKRILDTRLARCQILFDHFGIDRSDRRADARMVARLAFENYRGFQVERPRGRTASKKKSVTDIILLYAVDQAKKSTPRASYTDIIDKIALHNGWNRSAKNIRTLLRRYHSLRKDSRERQHAIEVAEELKPWALQVLDL